MKTFYILCFSILLVSCASVNGSETSRSVCRELERDLPTYSVKDTPQTLESGAKFIELFNAVCGVANPR